MSRIHTPISRQWYDELKAVGYFGEAELEDWIEQYSRSFFPDHYAIPYKMDVASRKTADTGKPDLILVTLDFSDWVVVEVELAQHGLPHVLRQANIFRNGEYNSSESAQYVRDKLLRIYRKSVTLKKLVDLFESKSPSILVIADKFVDGWKEALGRIQVKFGIVEIYKNVRGHYVYRTFGDYPIVEADAVHCRPQKGLRNVIEVVGKFNFKRFNKKGYIEVLYDEYLTQWDLIQKKTGKQYLRFLGVSNPLSLSERDTYSLYRDNTHKYYFKRS
jgi:hypothetical protein